MTSKKWYIKYIFDLHLELGLGGFILVMVHSRAPFTSILQLGEVSLVDMGNMTIAHQKE